MSDTVRLEQGDAVAEVALHGGELRSWRVGGVPLIWTPDPIAWADTAPLLFPVVGWTRDGRVSVDGRSYPLGLHGFARFMPFAVARRDAGRLTLVLEPTEGTRALYPFDFSLSVTYRLSGTSLDVDLLVRNTGADTMPYACGLHPGFRWPFAGGEPDDYAITFAEAEDPSVPVISPEGLFTAARRLVPLEGRRLSLSAAVLAREAICFLQARSRSLRFAREGGASITATLENFPHLALWSRPPGRFLSIEAWTGHGDLIDSDGDLRRKPSMISLAPGCEGDHRARFDFAP